VILDLNKGILKYRVKSGEKHRFTSAAIASLGFTNIEILVRMLNNPGRLFHAGNIRGSNGKALENERNLFSHSMRKIRTVFGQDALTGPYLFKQYDYSGITGTHRGCVYYFTDQLKYAVTSQQ
jgi:hypothetical protein